MKTFKSICVSVLAFIAFYITSSLSVLLLFWLVQYSSFIASVLDFIARASMMEGLFGYLISLVVGCSTAHWLIKHLSPDEELSRRITGISLIVINAIFLFLNFSSGGGAGINITYIISGLLISAF